MDTKEIKGIVDSAFEGLEGQLDEKMTKFFDERKKAITEDIEEKGFASKEGMEAELKKQKEDLEKTILEVKKMTMKEKSNEKVSFKSVLGDSLEENKEQLKALKYHGYQKQVR